jgi:hypothetical protein
MGHESTIYGAILSPDWKHEAFARLYEHNNAEILALPEEDSWPFLTRRMFAIGGDNVVDGRYRSQVIHFGATFKAVEWEWHEWLPKFESLLARLFWYDVYLHLRTELVGNYDYSYSAVAPSDRFYRREPPLPADHWTFRGGPRHFSSDGPGLFDENTIWEYAQGMWRVKTE